MVMTIHGLDQAVRDIGNDLMQSAKRGLERGAAVIPLMVTSNFYNANRQQEALGTSWPKTNYYWLQRRQTWPAQGSREEKDAYYKNHLPLVDTGTLASSFSAGPAVAHQDRVNAIITTSVDYGIYHEFGIPHEGVQVRTRSHMWVLPSDLPAIDAAFEQGMREI